MTYLPHGVIIRDKVGNFGQFEAFLLLLFQHLLSRVGRFKVDNIFVVATKLSRSLSRTFFNFGGLSPSRRMIGAKKTIAATKVPLTGGRVRQSL